MVEIKYKEKTYFVNNPGKLLYNKSNQLLNQLTEELIPFDNIRKYKSILLNEFGITEYDYYIIVVLYGDENKIPRCTYINPLTKEQCNHPQKFRSLIPKKGTKNTIFHEGCVEHLKAAPQQTRQLDLLNKGKNNLLFTDRRSKVWRERLKQHALKQIEEGNSIFSKDDVRRKDIKSVKEFNERGFYSNRLKNIGIDKSKLLTKEDIILADKLLFLSNGDENDKCYYYITELDGNPEVIKLGVTNNPNRRGEGTEYHGYFYKNYKIIYEGTRKQISEIEYRTKIEFINDICLGNEGFTFSAKDNIIDFINNIIKDF